MIGEKLSLSYRLTSIREARLLKRTSSNSSVEFVPIKLKSLNQARFERKSLSKPSLEFNPSEAWVSQRSIAEEISSKSPQSKVVIEKRVISSKNQKRVHGVISTITPKIKPKTYSLEKKWKNSNKLNEAGSVKSSPKKGPRKIVLCKGQMRSSLNASSFNYEL